ncbi:MAG TPA: S1 RNA-binding domain-containing protein [Lacipirellulaceae bacterium]|jgi:small subunit ribosomal protein S1|nr:S1 RNA-binding domain-containing protein [Lacipirellulaceae bacterium]
MSSDTSDIDQSQTDSSTSEQEVRPSERIRIGSQRNSLYRAAIARPSAAEEQSQAEATAPPAGVAEEARVEEAPPVEEPPKPKPVTPAAPTTPKKEPKHYPPPNIRDQLSPELEQEYQAALGDMSFDALMNAEAAVDTAPELAPESRVTGRVSRISREDVFIDLGGRNQGIVPLRQFEDKPPTEGAELELLVVRFDAEEGLYELSRPTAAVDVGNWDEVREGQIVEVNVTGSNKGGLECQIANIRGFIPMGQVSIYRVENPEEFVGQRLACVVTEANRERRNLVLSHRAVMERERMEKREKMLAELAPGQIREGIVRSMKDFGAFVDLGGLDGLIHVSQLSWDRVNHPSEVLELGQKVKVRIEKFDKESGKVSLSYREVGENPWQRAASKYIIGSRATGTVSRIMDFGAFVKLEPGIEGLIHVSELSHGRVFRVSDIVSEGQEVEVKILSVDAEKQRISLSLKALMAKPEKPGEQKLADEDVPLPADAPKPPRKKHQPLKGGIGGPSGGEKFGLNW